LSRRYQTKYHFVGYDLQDVGKRELATCDILLVQDIEDWDDFPLREHVPKGVEVIKFPCLRFASLWPFDSGNGLVDLDASSRTMPDSFFLFHDGLLARLRKRISDQERRFESYRTLQIDGVPSYVRLAELEEERLLDMDRKFESDIGQFILREYKTQPVFYAPGRPNGSLFTVLLAYLMERLDIDGHPPAIADFDLFKTHQVPVHPKIAAALGVSWASPDRSYRCGNEDLTWEAYTRRYIETYG
jgi:Polysaccharide biosynthesis enzyme WcbI